MRVAFFRKLLVAILFLIPCVYLAGQDKQYVINENKSEVSLIIDMKKTSFTVDNLLRKRMGQPLLEARLFQLGINMDTVGIWTESSNKKENIWKLQVEVPQAEAFFIELEDFYLPEGTQLYVYNKNNVKEATVFTHKDNPKGGAYSLENIFGDNVVLEYVANKNITEKPRIHLLDVGYKYSDESESISGYKRSQPCMININCAEGADWQVQKKGVVQIRSTKTDNINSNLCTGTLINNTNNDRKPYILTAYHCLEKVNVTNPNNFRFFFDYEASGCESPANAPSYKFHRGAEVKVLIPYVGGSDGALLELTEEIPDDWDVYFNGWDRENSTNNMTDGAIIHHPNGDVKKITLYEEKPQSGIWEGNPAEQTHWIIKYAVNSGATEGGSSGSPLFNRNGLVIGTLTGGDNSCTSYLNPDYYGKVWYHWDRSANGNEYMSKYLDPGNTGQTSIAGLHNIENIDYELVLDKTYIGMLQNESATINILSGNGEYTITSSNPNVATAKVTDKTISVQPVGFGTTTLTITDKKGKTKEVTVYIRRDIDFSVVDNKQMKISMYDGNADSDRIKQVRVITLDADVLYNKTNLDVESHQIDMSLFGKGFYIIQVKTKKGITKAEKIIW